MLNDLGQELSRATAPSGTGAPAAPGGPQTVPSERQPIPVEIRQPDPAPIQIIQNLVGPLLDPLATMAIVLVFIIFVLLQREDLRDRLIRLAGAHDLQRTTAAIDDAAHRVSRYLIAQSIVNATYGIPIALGLWLIGVPNPILWGILAMLLRFIPYVGPWIAALFPLALSIAVDPGWSMLLWTAALFVVIELASNNIVEPWLYGTSTGLSTIAIIVAATFWTWLWGPIGLVLATPLTSCLVALGRHVPRLQFLDVLLGSDPVLQPQQRFYQRMLAGDPDEATQNAEEFIAKEGRPLSAFYDEVALPGLALAQFDQQRGLLDEDTRARIKETIETVVDNLSDRPDAPSPPAAAAEGDADKPADAATPAAEPAPILEAADIAPEWRGKAVLCASARGDLDESAAILLAQLLEKHGIGARAVPCEAISSARLAQLDTEGIQAVCLSYLDPDSVGHARYVIRRLKRRLPKAIYVVGFWTWSDAAGDGRAGANLPRAADLGANAIATSLREAVHVLCDAACEQRSSPPATEREAAPAAARAGA